MGMRLPAMPAKKSDGLCSICTMTSRPSNCSDLLRTKAGQCAAPGTSSFSAANIWQPLQAPSAGGDGLDLELELHRETAVVQVDDAVVLLARRLGMVAQRLHAVGELAPDALHVVALVGVHGLVIAREADLVAVVELADDVRAGAEARLAQHLHGLGAIARADLDHRAELLVVERGVREVA